MGPERTRIADPDWFGPSVAVVVGQEPSLVDVGAGSAAQGGRTAPVEVYGPPGTLRMTTNVEETWG